MDFNLDATYGYINDIHKSKIIKYKPNNLITMYTVITNIDIILNREENHLNLHYSYLEIEFVVSDDAGGVFANNANIRLVNYGMMALFSSVNLETTNITNITNITSINIILNREENHLNLHDSYLEIEFVVSDDAGGVFANIANIRLVNYGMMALFSSIHLETSGGRTFENIDYCHPNLLMYKLLTSTDDEYKSGFVRNQGKRDSQIKGDHIAAD